MGLENAFACFQSEICGTDGSDQEDPFFIVNLGCLASLYNQVGFVITVVTYK